LVNSEENDLFFAIFAIFLHKTLQDSRKSSTFAPANRKTMLVS